MEAIRNAGGRFVGLTLNNGEECCARLVSESDKYLTVNDVNTGSTRKFMKSRITSVRTRGMEFA